MTVPEDTGPGARRDGSHIPEPERRGQRLISLLIGGLVLLNFPLLSIFSGNTFVYGIPVLYFYLFSVWSLIIGATAFVLRRKPSGSEAASDRQDFTES